MTKPKSKSYVKPSTDRKIELQKLVRKMQEIVEDFREKAFDTSNPQFMEFAELMKWYVDTCDNNLYRGIDFIKCNTETQKRIHISDWETRSLKRRLDNIFQGSISINLSVSPLPVPENEEEDDEIEEGEINSDNSNDFIVTDNDDDS